MFLSFFYLMRSSGLRVSLEQWLTVLQGLRINLHRTTLSGFYTLCRAVVAGSEADFDRFDEIFLEYFHDTAQEDGALPEELLRWLEHPELAQADRDAQAASTGLQEKDVEELFAQRLEDQDGEHNGGSQWIGTSGYTAYGSFGKVMDGIRVSGESLWRSAYRVAGERRYRDWRGDNTLDSRQFQAAFQSLRQISGSSGAEKTELDVDATVRETGRRAGRLQVEYTYPRRNQMKVLLLIDSGGSMEQHQRLCSLLFQSVSKAGHYKELKIYYFHNCVERILYTEPTLSYLNTISTKWVLQNLGEDYRVILVGDAMMAPRDLVSHSGQASGWDWLMRFRDRYPHIIWLHPQPAPTEHSYWTGTFELLSRKFDMFQMSLEGLTAGMRKLMENR